MLVVEPFFLFLVCGIKRLVELLSEAGLEELLKGEPAFQATYWHNALFNPALPGGLRVLAFQPDWARAEAEPGVG